MFLRERSAPHLHSLLFSLDFLFLLSPPILPQCLVLRLHKTRPLLISSPVPAAVRSRWAAQRLRGPVRSRMCQREMHRPVLRGPRAKALDTHLPPALTLPSVSYCPPTPRAKPEPPAHVNQ